jgi:hypothetical protein
MLCLIRLTDIAEMISLLPSFCFSHVKRAANNVAHLGVLNKCLRLAVVFCGINHT